MSLVTVSTVALQVTTFASATTAQPVISSDNKPTFSPTYTYIPTTEPSVAPTKDTSGFQPTYNDSYSSAMPNNDPFSTATKSDSSASATEATSVSTTSMTTATTKTEETFAPVQTSYSNPFEGTVTDEEEQTYSTTTTGENPFDSGSSSSSLDDYWDSPAGGNSQTSSNTTTESTTQNTSTGTKYKPEDVDLNGTDIIKLTSTDGTAYFAYKYSDSVYFIYDKNGSPLGYIETSTEPKTEDMDNLSKVLKAFGKENPSTSDLSKFLVPIAILVLGASFFVYSKYFNLKGIKK